MLAEDGDTSTDGLQPLGSAQLASVTDDGFVVTNIGTSGEDGVEIPTSSVFGDGIEVDLGALLFTAGATCNIEQNDPDGQSLGNTHILSNGDGVGVFTFDYSALGATAVHILEYDRQGVIVLDEMFPGPVFQKPGVPLGLCPNGNPPVFAWVPTSYQWPNGETIYTWVWRCPGGNTFTVERAIAVIPILPSGSPEVHDVQSMSVTAAGVPELTFSAL